MGIEYEIRCSAAAVDRLLPALALREWIRPTPEPYTYTSLSLPHDVVEENAPVVLLNRTPTGLILTDMLTVRPSAALIILGILDELIAVDGTVVVGEECIQR